MVVRVWVVWVVALAVEVKVVVEEKVEEAAVEAAAVAETQQRWPTSVDGDAYAWRLTARAARRRREQGE